MNNHTIWTRYYTPREFYRRFSPQFSLEHFRGLCVFDRPHTSPGFAKGILVYTERFGDWIDRYPVGL